MIAGTTKSAELRHELPQSVFPRSVQTTSIDERRAAIEEEEDDDEKRVFSDDYDAGLDDSDFLAAAGDVDFVSIDSFDNRGKSVGVSRMGRKKMQTLDLTVEETTPQAVIAPQAPTQLENGNWACNHRCKDKTKYDQDHSF